MVQPPKILVVGGGAAGLCCVTQLARRGITATLWEKRPPETEGGYAVGLWKNGFDVLSKLGVAEVKTGGKVSNFSQLTDEKGRVIRHADLSPLNQKYGSAVVFMTRGALLQKLRETAAASTVIIRHDTALTKVEARDGKVRATDSCGNEEFFDLLVAADGIYSPVRNMIFGGDLKEHNAVFYYASVSMAGWTPPLEGDIEMTGAGTFLGLYPLAGEWCGVYAAIYRRPGLLRRPPGEVLAEFFGNFGGYAPAVVAACQDTDVFGDIIREARPSRWSARRCILIGDAAHAMLPTTGQGLSLAMEDGLLLADIIADSSPEQWAKQFAAFEKLRRRRIAPIRRRAALVNFIANYTPTFLCPMRNALIRLTARGSKTAALDEFFQQKVVGNKKQ